MGVVLAAMCIPHMCASVISSAQKPETTTRTSCTKVFVSGRQMRDGCCPRGNVHSTHVHVGDKQRTKTRNHYENLGHKSFVSGRHMRDGCCPRGNVHSTHVRVGD